MAEAARLLPVLNLPDPLVLPLDRFDEGLARFRDRDVLKVVFVP
jgi:hypothetical protein